MTKGVETRLQDAPAARRFARCPQSGEDRIQHSNRASAKAGSSANERLMRPPRRLRGAEVKPKDPTALRRRETTGPSVSSGLRMALADGALRWLEGLLPAAGSTDTNLRGGPVPEFDDSVMRAKRVSSFPARRSGPA